MMRVVTCTLNPAIDQTIMLDELRPGHVHRAKNMVLHAGGKGVNVASCLADWGGTEITATGILGRDNAGIFEALCSAKNIHDGFIRIPGETRTNLKLCHDGDTTDINFSGPRGSAETRQSIFDRMLQLCTSDTLALLAGSVPEGVGPGIYGELTGEILHRGGRVFLDTSGLPLECALHAPSLPFCIKPNRAELEEFAGTALDTDNAMITVARELLSRGVGLVVISLGAQGALFVTGAEILRAALPVLRVDSSVGAGDAMMAGLIAATCENAGLEATARLATAFASAKLQRPGANLPPRNIVEALSADVRITGS